MVEVHIVDVGCAEVVDGDDVGAAERVEVDPLDAAVSMVMLPKVRKNRDCLPLAVRSTFSGPSRR